MKRSLDVIMSLLILLLTAPLFLLVALAVRIFSPGPVFYRAIRVGLGGALFEMLKFRTMHVSDGGPVITARHDTRIFPIGSLLRRLKLDELPQFINVLRGEMAIVGPRPEDPKIVDQAYTPWMMETLTVRPGVTSPGAVFYYACGEALIDPADPETSYVQRLLPAKLAIERGYMERATTLSDVVCIFHTAAAIVGEALGRPVYPLAADFRAALKWVPESAFPCH